ncbi:MAG: hypothetical protein HPY30_01140 [Gammaproteobacteria bacterium (ex Lamellibrachia satsuma)]|nr:MAG: hypothetical protein HPY30_01140 [Gammaproteobacteria bacterium (ex Lamellibrachia satsuma)]
MKGTVSQPNAITLTLTIFVLVLSGCSAPSIKLTDGHVENLKEAFVGREFVFRTDWHHGMVIYKGKPMGNFYATMHNQTSMVKKRKHQLGDLVSRGGDTATFINIAPSYNYRLFLTFKSSQGDAGSIIIMSPNKDSWGSEYYEDMTDSMATVPWVENQLTNATIKFLDKTETDAAEIPAVLPAPPMQPKLTPTTPTVPTPVQMTEPSISRLSVTATPSRVRHGEVLKLQLDYTIDAADGKPVQVTESRNLVFNSKALPGYPKERQETRGNGRHSTNFRQKIPSKAQPGSYTYKGEVCIPAGCTSRLVRFSIEP